MAITNKETAQHYSWGSNCDGWHLVQSKNLSVIQERIPSGCSEERHFHHKAEQFFFILSGIATMEMDGEIFTLAANSGIHIASGAKHQLSNNHAEDLHFIVTSTPPSHGDRSNV